MAKEINKCDIKFGAIACRGVSGMVIAPALAIELKKDLIICRKEDAHSRSAIEGRMWSNYIIVDDFIESGRTVIDIMRAIDIAHKDELRQSVPPGSKPFRAFPDCQAIFLYHAKKRDRKLVVQPYEHPRKGATTIKRYNFNYVESKLGKLC